MKLLGLREVGSNDNVSTSTHDNQ